MFEWWWNADGLARAQVVLGAASLAVSLFLAILGLWVAYRQMKIAEVQNDIMLATMARKSRLRLYVRIIRSTPEGWLSHLLVENRGDTPCTRAAFRVMVPREHAKATFVAATDVMPQVLLSDVPGNFSSYSGVFEKTVFPGAEVKLADLTVKRSFKDELVVDWSLQTESDKFPLTGFARIRFSRTDPGHIDWAGREGEHLFLHQ